MYLSSKPAGYRSYGTELVTFTIRYIFKIKNNLEKFNVTDLKSQKSCEKEQKTRE